jgi:CHAT domain-containing protein
LDIHLVGYLDVKLAVTQPKDIMTSLVIQVDIHLFAVTSYVKGMAKLDDADLKTIRSVLHDFNLPTEAVKPYKQVFLDTLTQKRDAQIIVHLSGHGKRDQKASQDIFTKFSLSGCLVMQSENNVESDNICIFANEIVGLDLSSVQLLVLNVCHTWGFSVPSRSGNMSLARAFMIAGVQCIIATLMETSDDAAEVFTRYLYKGLRDDLTIADAFYHAIKALQSGQMSKGYFHGVSTTFT